MAISYTTRGTLESTSNASSYSTGSYTPGSNKVLVAFVFATATALNHTQVTFSGNGLTWVPIESNSRGVSYLYAAYALTGSSPSTGAFTFDCTGDAATGCMIRVIEVDGADLTDPIGLTDVATETAAAGTPSISFGGTTASTSGVLAALANTSNPPGVTEPSGYTEVCDVGITNPISGMEVVSHTGPGAVTGATWQSTVATASSQIGLEILAAASGTNITHATLTTTPSLPAARLDHSISHATLTTTPTMPQASITAGQTITHATLTVTPTLPQAAVQGAAIAKEYDFENGADGNTLVTTDPTGTANDADDVDISGDNIYVYDNARAHSGSLSALLSGGATSGVSRWEWNYTNDEIFVRFYIYIPSASTWDSTVELVRVADSGGLRNVAIRISSTRRLRILDAAGTNQSLGTALAEDAWHRIEGHFKLSTGLAEVRSFSGADLEDPASTPTETSTELTGLSIGSATSFVSFGSAAGSTNLRAFNIDDVAISSSDWVGPTASGGQTVTHATLTTTPSLPAARVDHSLSHATLTTTPSLPAATVTAERTATHATLTVTPTLPQARIDHSLTHQTLTVTPSLPAATITAERTATHVTLTVTPTLPQARIDHSLTHATLTVTPSLPAALVAPSQTVTHATLTVTPSLPAATITAERTATHQTLTVTPTLPQARIDHSVAHATLTVTPTQPQARLDHTISHATLTVTPTQPQAGLLTANTVNHNTLTVTPTLPPATITAERTATHQTLTVTPTLPQARLDHTLTHQTLTTTPTQPQAALFTENNVVHVTLTTSPTLPVARIDHSVVHVTLTSTPELPPAEVQAEVVVVTSVGLSWAEMEVPDGARSAEIGWVEMVLQPGNGRDGYTVSSGDLGVPGSGTNKHRRRYRGLGRHIQTR